MSMYAHKTFKEAAEYNTNQQHEIEIARWLKSRPEVGILSSGKFYTNAPFKTIHPLSPRD
jgi:hypothetical protein